MQVARALLLEPGSGSPSPTELVLKELGVSVTRCAGVDSFRAALESADFDLWVISVTGAEDPAWQLVELSPTSLPEGACLFVMGEDGHEAFERALAAGAYAYLSLPASELPLRQALRQCVERVQLGRENQALRREAGMYQMLKNIALAMDLEKLLSLVMDASLAITGASAGSVLLRDEESGDLSAGASRGLDDAAPRSAFFNLSADYLAGLLRGGHAVHLGPQSPEIRTMRAGERTVESALLAPIVDQGRALGLAIVGRTAPPPFDGSSLRALARLTEETSAAFNNALSVRRTRELVIKDDLTDAYNRRYFESYLEDEMQRSKRYGTNLSLIFLDLDNLKAINNQHGHFIGSKTLQEVAHRIILTVRGIDKVVRYGGDEFCVILPETDVEGANRVAERIRQNVAQYPFLIQEGLNLAMTVSIGIACCPLHARSKDELVKKADMAMFASKAATKNVVTVAT